MTPVPHDEGTCRTLVYRFRPLEHVAKLNPVKGDAEDIRGHRPREPVDLRGILQHILGPVHILPNLLTVDLAIDGHDAHGHVLNGQEQLEGIACTCCCCCSETNPSNETHMRTHMT